MINILKKCFAIFSISIPFLATAQDLDSQNIEDNVETAWQDSSAIYYSPKTNLFYTREVSTIPSCEDMKALKPILNNGRINYAGSGSGTEDCSMLSGIVLAGLCDKFIVKGDDQTASRARKIASGLILADTVHGEKGFVARGVSPQDCKTIYPATSRDQYTHNIHGLWRFYHSKISTKKEKKQIAQIFADIAEKMKREITPQTIPPYSFKQFDGLADTVGVAKMLDVYPHEAARLAMFYAAAYDTTKKQKYLDWYNDAFQYAIERTQEFPHQIASYYKNLVPTYSIAQMMASLELIREVEPNAQKRKIVSDTMDNIAEFVENNPRYNINKSRVRETSEVVGGQLLADSYQLSPAHKAALIDRITHMYQRESAGAYTMLAAYWRARVKQMQTK